MHFTRFFYGDPRVAQEAGTARARSIAHAHAIHSAQCTGTASEIHLELEGRGKKKMEGSKGRVGQGEARVSRGTRFATSIRGSVFKKCSRPGLHVQRLAYPRPLFLFPLLLHLPLLFLFLPFSFYLFSSSLVSFLHTLSVSLW